MPLATVHHLGWRSCVFAFMELLYTHRGLVVGGAAFSMCTNMSIHTHKHTHLLGRGRLFQMMDVTLLAVNTVPLLLLIAQSERWNICY